MNDGKHACMQDSILGSLIVYESLPSTLLFRFCCTITYSLIPSCTGVGTGEVCLGGWEDFAFRIRRVKPPQRNLEYKEGEEERNYKEGEEERN